MVRRILTVLALTALVTSLPSSALAQPTVGGAGSVSALAAVPRAYVSVERVIEADEIGFARPEGITWDRQDQRLLVFDAARPGQGIAMTRAGAVTGQVVGDGAAESVRRDFLAALQRDRSGLGTNLRGLAVHPINGHLFVYAPSTRTLWELEASGAPITRRDLTGAGLDDVRAMTVAPTADSTDDPARMAVYAADAGRLRQGSLVGAGVYEIALSRPAVSVAAAGPGITAVNLVNTINTGAGSGQWSPDSPDPSGMTYVPSLNRLVSADGEVDETTGAGFHNANVWFATLDGQSTSTADTTNDNPANNEPTGVAYDPVKDELYISKDGANGRVWVYDPDVPNTVKRSFTVTGAPYNNADAEGLAFGNGVLYMVDAIDNDLVKVQPGGNGTIGTGNDDVVNNFDLQQYGQSEPEGLDVHPTTGNIWIVSNKVSGGGVPDPMIEVTPNGALVSTESIAAANPNSAGGLAIAPPSNGGGGFNIYIADRGVDNNTNPNENDGKIYEFNTGGVAPPVADFTFAQVPGTLQVNFTDASSGNVDTWLWDFGDAGSSTVQNPSHTYAAPGTFQVMLIVTGPGGTDSVTKSVTVVDPNIPVADFTFAQVSGTLTVNFTDASSGNPNAWLWDFGDTGSSNQQNPSHTYAAPGSYQVTLTASNASGSDSVTKTVTVTDPNPPANMMANPGFELDANGDNRPDNWTTNNAFTRSSAVVHTGSFAGRHLSTANNGYNVYQLVTGINAGTPYAFNGWVNIPTTNDGFTFKIQLKWRNASGGAISTSTIFTRKVSTSGWLQINGGATAPAGAASVRVTMTLSSLSATIYVDDFSLTG